MFNNCIVSDRKKQRKYMHIQIWFYRTKIEPSSKLFPRCGSQYHVFLLLFFLLLLLLFFCFFFNFSSKKSKDWETVKIFSKKKKKKKNPSSRVLSLFTIIFFILTHLCRVDSSTSTLWTGSFQVGMVSG